MGLSECCCIVPARAGWKALTETVAGNRFAATAEHGKPRRAAMRKSKTRERALHKHLVSPVTRRASNR